MAQIHHSSILAAAPERIWEHLNRPDLLEYLSRGRFRFRPVDPPCFPEVWEEREYHVALFGFGWIPLGWQVIGIERPAAADGKRVLRDRGRGLFFRSWEHTLTVEAAGDGKTLYTDDVVFDAGPFTLLILPLLRGFFIRRHKRWARLVERGFDYGA